MSQTVTLKPPFNFQYKYNRIFMKFLKDAEEKKIEKKSSGTVFISASMLFVTAFATLL